jgi:hypothetical protein
VDSEIQESESEVNIEQPSSSSKTGDEELSSLSIKKQVQTWEYILGAAYLLLLIIRSRTKIYSL